MSAAPAEMLRLTVLGCSTAAPHPASPAAGFLVEWGSTSLMLDAGQGTIRRLERVLDPHDLKALVIGHMHADHYLDVVGLRYLFAWGEATPNPLPVHLPPEGKARLDQLANAVSERPGFFDAAFAVSEYAPGDVLHVGPLTVRPIEAQHYVPAFGMIVDAPDGIVLLVGCSHPGIEAIVAETAKINRAGVRLYAKVQRSRRFPVR